MHLFPYLDTGETLRTQRNTFRPRKMTNVSSLSRQILYYTYIVLIPSSPISIPSNGFNLSLQNLREFLPLPVSNDQPNVHNICLSNSNEVGRGGCLFL